MAKTGKFIFANGDEYDGEYDATSSSIHRQGQGTFTTKDGCIMGGEWSDDEMNGMGTFIHPSGCVYQGQFVNGYFEGAGTYTWPDGSTYRGNFKRSKLDDPNGLFVDANGQTWIGRFQGDSTQKLKFKLDM